MSKIKSGKSTKILILAPYPHGQVASQRFRFEQYIPYLHKDEYIFKQKSFYSIRTWTILYQNGHIFSKVTGTISGYLKRILHTFQALSYNYILIHREVTPAGPPWFEFIISRIFRKKVIYDFDDAIWLPNTTETNRVISGLKWHDKVKSICRWSCTVSCGNEFLREYSLRFNRNTQLIPTTIDTENYHNRIKNQDSQSVVIGWTGTHSTVKYLKIILPALRKLKRKKEFEFLVICDKDPALDDFAYKFKKWKKSSEITDLLEINIGIMPLTDEEWSKGKCGFKALQFMSLGIPVLVSPVGVNKDIVDHDQNGYHCHTDEDWITNADKLIDDPPLRTKLGMHGRDKVKTQYSTRTNLPRFLALFE